LPQQETKSSTKQLAPTDPILGPENLLKTGFAQKGLFPVAISHKVAIEAKTLRFWSPDAKNFTKMNLNTMRPQNRKINSKGRPVQQTTFTTAFF